MKTNIKLLLFAAVLTSLVAACEDKPTMPEIPTPGGGGPDVDKPQNVSQTWLNYLYQNDENILVDYSFAGYKYGEVEPPAVETLGYTTYNITDAKYGAIPNDNLSDQAAFEMAMKDAIADPVGGIVYCPEGKFELRAQNDKSSMMFNGGNIVIKGASRDKTILKMSYANALTNPAQLWTAPPLIHIKHNSGTSHHRNVTEDAPIGSYSVTVENTAGLSVGMWVALELKDNDPEVVKYALGEGDLELGNSRMQNLIPAADIIQNGVDVDEYHVIKKIVGNVVTFHEPIHHKINKTWNWKLAKYNNYENVAVEDICFQGEAPAGFQHHKLFDTSYGTGFSYDCAFTPLSFNRLTNSWMRRVNFVSVSDCLSISGCSNVSVYDIRISGNRGHCAVKSNGSTKVFIGKVKDMASGSTGQWHGVGVAKPAIGTVIWRSNWGSSACYESHASQPRVSLIDMCTGAFKTGHQGGAEGSLPNHMEGMVMWNFNASSGLGDVKLAWWDFSSKYWKLLPVALIGYHGANTTFSPVDTKVDESHGQKVYPESLYEAQLERRLGYVPSWLLEIKAL